MLLLPVGITGLERKRINAQSLTRNRERRDLVEDSRETYESREVLKLQQESEG